MLNDSRRGLLLVFPLPSLVRVAKSSCQFASDLTSSEAALQNRLLRHNNYFRENRYQANVR